MLYHLQLFYFFISFTGGFTSLIISYLLYFKTKERYFRVFLCFYTNFTFFIVLKLISDYVLLNTNYIQFLFFTIAISDISYYGVIILSTFLVHDLFDIKAKKIINIGLTIFMISLFILYKYFSDISIGNGVVEFIYKYEFLRLHELLFTLILLYNIIIGFFYLSKKNQKFNVLAKRMLISYTICFPGIALDIINNSIIYHFFNFKLPHPFLTFPAYYLILGIVFAYYLFKKYLDIANFQPDEESLDSYCHKNQISIREKEIVNQVLEGLPNVKIAENLFISKATVKTHLNSIYKKAGITSRYELILKIKQQK
jgi:DNA-binding CsgD family transcriptional regulator